MKKLLVVLSLVSSAANAAAVLSCDSVKDNSVTVDIQSTKEIPSLVRAFYNCVEKKQSIQAAKQAIVEATRDSGMGTAEQCKFLAPRVLLSTSWHSGRYSIYGEAGGEYVYDVSQAYYCSAVGTGLFEGNQSRLQVRVKVDHTEKNLEMCAPDLCKDEKAKNKVTLQLLENN